jgi:hypothetical protein
MSGMTDIQVQAASAVALAQRGPAPSGRHDREYRTDLTDIRLRP